MSNDWRADAGVPRRACVDLMKKPELAIRAAIHAVEEAGADPRLTRAVILLGKAQDRVADFIDGVDHAEIPPKTDAQIQTELRRNVLNAASRAIENGMYEQACALINTLHKL